MQKEAEALGGVLGKPHELVASRLPVVTTGLSGAFGDTGAMNDSTSRHFSLANAVTDGMTDLPRLLRRVADQIEADHITCTELLDVMVHSEITAGGPHWSVTVYWSPDDDNQPERGTH